MMTDIHNLQAFALYMQKTDIKFDLYSVTKEMEKQVYMISKFIYFIRHWYGFFFILIYVNFKKCWTVISFIYAS